MGTFILVAGNVLKLQLIFGGTKIELRLLLKVEFMPQKNVNASKMQHLQHMVEIFVLVVARQKLNFLHSIT